MHYRNYIHNILAETKERKLTKDKITINVNLSTMNRYFSGTMNKMNKGFFNKKAEKNFSITLLSI